MNKKSQILSGFHSKEDTPNFVTIPAGENFLETLAQQILDAVGNDPLALTQYEIFLPTRRAMRALSANFIRLSKNKTSLLPRIKAIGALDDDITLTMDNTPFDNSELLPAISSLERRLVLAQLIAKKNIAFSGTENWVAALSAATELTKLLDSFYTEEVPFSELDKLLPEDLQLAEHWKISQEFLSIVTTAWPAYLEENQYLDPVARRIALIHHATKRWQQNPPTHPIIIAGSTGSTPAVASMMNFVANLPNGFVILPGLDLDLDSSAWEQIDDAHPQSGLKALLNALKLTRNEISSLKGATQLNQTPSKARQDLLRLALRPADATDDWLSQINEIPHKNSKTDLDNFQLAELQDEEEEATAISLLIRETLETPGKKVMLVTPDRDLTRRVSTKLKRWAIDADDSGGVPFSNTPCGTFLRLIAQWLTDKTNPIYLLAILRHPLCNNTLNGISNFSAISHLDKGLRGLKPGPEFKHLRISLKQRLSPKSFDGVQSLLSWIEGAIALAVSSSSTTFTDHLRSHLSIAEYLSDTELTSEYRATTPKLWSSEDGIAGSSLMTELLESAHLISSNIENYATIFDQLISGEIVRRVRPAHPRVSILGPLEARLQHADHIILSGLNEGIWPGDSQIDGFLSRPMRQAIELPSPERRIGLSAHDFSQLAASSKVTLTRSKRTGNAPATPSRWMVRLQNILKGIKHLHYVDRSETLEAWCKTLNAPAKQSIIKKPAPRPPVEARPNELFVTSIEKWLRDPYSIYARYILELRKLDGLNEEFDARHVGNIIHTIFEKCTNDFLRDDGQNDKITMLNALKSNLARELELINLPARVLSLWRPSFDTAIEWFAAWHQQRLEEGNPAVIEKQGQWTFNTASGDFTIKAKPDRIDVLTDLHQKTSAAVYDYKTGTLPSLKQIITFNPQLTLTGLIVSENGFDSINTTTISRLALVKSLNRKTNSTDLTGDDIRLLSEPNLEESLKKSKRSLIELVQEFNDPQTPYLSQPRPEFISKYGDYDHLARRAEWASEQDDAESGNV